MITCLLKENITSHLLYRYILQSIQFVASKCKYIIDYLGNVVEIVEIPCPYEFTNCVLVAFIHVITDLCEYIAS